MNASIRRATAWALVPALFLPARAEAAEKTQGRPYNGPYAGERLDRVAFPIGGIGAGMFCLDGTGAISHVSFRHKLEPTHEPCTFAAISVQGPETSVAKVLEGPVPDWKVFGGAGTGLGSVGKSYGLPRFDHATFLARFPFGVVTLSDGDVPLDIELTGWSPFLPGRADDSSLPVGALEYRFRNTGDDVLDLVFSFHTKHFMRAATGGERIRPIENGFVLWQPATEAHPEQEDGCAVVIDDPEVVVDHCWFDGDWWDALTLAWRNARTGQPVANPAADRDCSGASLYSSFALDPGAEHTVRLMLTWYVPRTKLRYGRGPADPAFANGPSRGTGPRQQPVTGFLGNGLVNTFDPDGDAAVGILTSPEFELEHDYVQFLIGGGRHPGGTCLQLLVGDEVARSAHGRDAEQLEWTTWETGELKGRRVRIRVVDRETRGWGHINVDQIVSTDRRWESAVELMENADAWGDAVTILHDFEGDDFGDWVASEPERPGVPDNQDSPAAPDAMACPIDPASTEATAVSEYHVPWYAGRFDSLEQVVTYWRENYGRLRRESALFRDAFYDTTLPPEVIEAVAANLTILKTPTVHRQTDGRLWCFEGCGDDGGSCHGSCTHVWNYAQALPHLFPELERSLRRTEFNESQDERGHQTFRSCLPIRPVGHGYYAAADGQLGGIMKVYRDWRISGDSDWLCRMWPKVRQSLEYCIRTWDPRRRGMLEEPHHNTYDIEYWGPNGHCSSVYLGALTAAIRMGTFLGEDVSPYQALRDRGRAFLETELYNGEYFFQRVQTDGLDAAFEPLDASAAGTGYRGITASLNEQGPRYQYGNGCLSDGVFGFWLARACGLDDDIVDPAKVRSNLRAIHRYNLRRNLSDHANPQRPGFAVGDDGGLLLCTWPQGAAPLLPFVYSNEVWTGIEYQVASHLMMVGLVDEGLEIVRVCRDRYNGTVRNPFNEYECGHWYARALSSYALLQGLTGARYDAVERTLYIDSRIGDSFRSFLATESGFGTVGLDDGQPFLEVRHGEINVDATFVSGERRRLTGNHRAADTDSTRPRGP